VEALFGALRFRAADARARVSGDLRRAVLTHIWRQGFQVRSRISPNGGNDRALPAILRTVRRCRPSTLCALATIDNPFPFQ